MKKLVLVLAVAFSASLFSCGNKAENAEVAADSTAVVEEVVEEVATVDSIGTDSAASDTVVAAAAEVVAAK